MFTHALRPFRGVFLWQLLATTALALAAAWFSGAHGALSAVAGGLIGFVAGLGFVLTLFLSRASRDAGSVIVTALRAEGVKIVLTIALLWAVFANYSQVVAVVFIATFAVSVIIFSLASFARVEQVKSS